MVKLSCGKGTPVKVETLEERKNRKSQLDKDMDYVRDLIAKTGIKTVGENGEFTDKKGRTYVIEWRRSGKTEVLTGDGALKMFGLTADSIDKIKRSRTKVQKAMEEQADKMVELEAVTAVDENGQEVVIDPSSVRGA